MNKFNTRKRSKSYFYITEDSPLPAIQQQEITGLKVPLPNSQQYFFIDFSSSIFCDSARLRAETDEQNLKQRWGVQQSFEHLAVWQEHSHEYGRLFPSISKMDEVLGRTKQAQREKENY